MCLATIALDGGLDAMPADQVASMAARTLSSAAALADRQVRAQVMALAAVAFHMIDHFADAAAILDRLLLETADAGLAGAQVGVLAHQASLHLRLGSLDRAAEAASRAIELDAETRRATSVLPRAAAVLIGVATERGEQPPVQYLTDNIDRDSISFRLLDHARAEWMAATGQHAAAASALLAYGERNRDLGWDGTATAWRSQAAACLAATGRVEEARALVDEEVVLARKAGAPRALGIALRAAGLLATGTERRLLLEEACRVHDGSPVVLEAAWSSYALGVEYRETGTLPLSRERLRQAHATASTCGAHRLAELAADQLRSAGGRPASRTDRRSVLTDAEVRVTELAAAGRTNRQIAQILFVTEKTVETHLAHAYRKLGIRSRQELPASSGAVGRRADGGDPQPRSAR
jgi:DNA-binding CsgD family transcriptional regulator